MTPLLLTFNERLARQCNGISWRSWLLQQWGQKNASYTLLTPVQTLHLWQTIIAERVDASLNTLMLSHLAQEAYERCVVWQKKIIDIPTGYRLEVSEFVAWATAFEGLLAKNHWITEAQAIQSSISSLFSDVLPHTIECVGMLTATQTPQLEVFLKTLESLGVNVRHQDSCHPDTAQQASGSSITVYECQHRSEEYQHAAEWAKTQALEKKRVAIVIPDLQTEWRTIQRVMKNGLGGISYQISGGLPLTYYPIVEVALSLFALKRTHSFDLISQVARYPYIGYACSEQSARHLLDIQLRQKLSAQVTLSEWIEQQEKLGLCPHWLHLLTELVGIKWPSTAKPSIWVSLFKDALKILGFPGEETLSSPEFQTVQRFEKALEELNALDLVVPALSAEAFLDVLREHLESIVFQPESPQNPAIQILGMLESVGLSFDGIWVCGLTHTQFPPPAAPHPLLPVEWQRQLDMPQASQAQSVRFAKQLLSQWQKQTPVLYMSYAAQEKDLPVEPSPLLKGMKQEVIPVKQSVIPAKAGIQDFGLDSRLRGNDTTKGENDIVSAITTEERTQLQGGASILKSQAICPFQAFALFRLKSQRFPEPIEHLNAQWRGNLLHDLLEKIWNRLKTQETLKKYTLENGWQWLEQIIVQVLKTYQLKWPRILTSTFFELEKNRLMVLMQRWLSIEAEREDFTVLAQEKTMFSHIAGIPLTLRIDRLDQLASGHKILIDYKTGAVSRGKWYGDRPTEPQLPLYAMGHPVSGIAFAKVHPKYLGFEGVADTADALPGVKNIAKDSLADASDWPGQVQHWNQTLTQLAESFLQGDVRVDPISDSEGCARCHLQGVCRVSEERS